MKTTCCVKEAQIVLLPYNYPIPCENMNMRDVGKALPGLGEILL